MRLALLALLAATTSAISSSEESERALRLKTSRQLKEILDDLDIAYPSGSSKEKLREIAMREDAWSQYERDFPDKVNKYKGKPPSATTKTKFSTGDEKTDNDLGIADTPPDQDFSDIEDDTKRECAACRLHLRDLLVRDLILASLQDFGKAVRDGNGFRRCQIHGPGLARPARRRDVKHQIGRQR